MSSLSNILDPNTADRTWKDLQVNSITVKGAVTFNGNQSITNSNPSLSIINNTTNANRSTLLLQGASNLIASKLQQDQTGKLILQTFNTNSGVDIIPNGSGLVSLLGDVKITGSLPAGPYSLGLDASNKIVRNSSYGTFIPQLKFNGASTGITYLSQVGFYNKIDKSVFFSINIVLTNKGSSTGAATISNLPFPIAVDDIAQTVYWVGVLFDLDYTFVAATTSSLFNYLNLLQGSTSQSKPVIALQNSGFNNTTSLTVSGFYIAT